MKSKIKMIFFDMEGTLFRKVNDYVLGNTAPSAWTLISEQLGPKAAEEERKTKDKWNSKKYRSYMEWMEDTIGIHVKYGLTKKMFEKAMSAIEYHPGVKETFKELAKRGYKTSLISGGFKAQADRAQKDLKIDHSFAACEYFWNADGTIAHFNLLPCDYEGKVDFMHLIMKDHGLKPEQCAFVGDGRNDIVLAKAVGTSIAFNAQPELQKVCTHSINQKEGKEDFREILEFF